MNILAVLYDLICGYVGFQDLKKWCKRKLKSLLCLALILLLSGFAHPFFSVSYATVPEKGTISFQPNRIPELVITERVGKHGESFRFAWADNTFDIELFFSVSGRIYSLKDLEADYNLGVDYVSSKTANHVQFGWVVHSVDAISNLVDSAWFKIEDSSFDYEEIELEEIDSFVDLGYNITRFHLPDNLCLSFEDLHHKGFVIGHQDKTSTQVKGFSGKTSWNLDPIVESGGVVTITGYDSEAGAADHDDIWTELDNETQFAKQGANQYSSAVKIVIGDGENTTWFVDTNVQVSFNSTVFTANYDIAYDVKTNSHLRFGVLHDAEDKIGRDGVSVYMKVSGYLLGQSMFYGRADSSVLLYACHLVDNHEDWAYGGRISSYGTTHIYTTLVESMEIWGMGGTLDIFEVIGTRYSTDKGNSQIVMYGATPTVDRVNLYAGKWHVQFFTNKAGNIANVYHRGSINEIIYCQDITVDHSLTDCDLEVWTFRWQGTSTAEIYRDYSFDATTYFTNGSIAENANVTISNDYLGTSDSWLTFANGSIPQQTYSYGHYNQTGGNTIYDYNPYNITVTMDGCETYTDIINITQQEDLRIALMDEVETETETTEIEELLAGAGTTERQLIGFFIRYKIHVIIVFLMLIGCWYCYKYITKKVERVKKISEDFLRDR